MPVYFFGDNCRCVFASGNLDKKISIHTGDEIEQLATSFNAMTDELKIYMANLARETAEHERISTELNVAANIQQSMLPHDFPSRADFELFATMNAGNFAEQYPERNQTPSGRGRPIR